MIMIEGVEHPSNHAATKITCSVLGIATAAAVGLYLYKRRHHTETKSTETEHSDSTPDLEDVLSRGVEVEKLESLHSFAASRA